MHQSYNDIHVKWVNTIKNSLLIPKPRIQERENCNHY